MKLSMRLCRLSPMESAIALYENSQEISINVDLSRRRIVVPAALVRREELAEILDGEEYAGTIGGLFFVTEETPKEYLHFASFHELIEHAAPRGFDVTGLAEHFQAVTVEIGYAKATLIQEDFDNYYQWRKNIEKTAFFGMDSRELVNKISQEIEEIFRSLPKYLYYRDKTLVGLNEE